MRRPVPNDTGIITYSTYMCMCVSMSLYDKEGTWAESPFSQQREGGGTPAGGVLNMELLEKDEERWRKKEHQGVREPSYRIFSEGKIARSCA